MMQCSQVHKPRISPSSKKIVHGLMGRLIPVQSSWLSVITSARTCEQFAGIERAQRQAGGGALTESGLKRRPEPPPPDARLLCALPWRPCQTRQKERFCVVKYKKGAVQRGGARAGVCSDGSVSST